MVAAIWEKAAHPSKVTHRSYLRKPDCVRPRVNVMLVRVGYQLFDKSLVVAGVR